jgi:N-glycosylase/DNA lyase
MTAEPVHGNGTQVLWPSVGGTLRLWGAAVPVAAPMASPQPDVLVREASPACGCCSPSPWGPSWELGSAAFWVEQVTVDTVGGERDREHALGRSLREEVVACMLGGHGVPGDVGVAAFGVLRDAGLLDGARPFDVARSRQLLSAPFTVPGRPRPVRYRYHQQRPARIAEALDGMNAWAAAVDLLDDVALRDRLVQLPGIGPKTASWIVRNHRGSDRVAIIDVHVRRAGVAAGVFCANWQLPRDYALFESAFLSWAAVGGVSAAELDATVWFLCARMGHDIGLLLGGNFA